MTLATYLFFIFTVIGRQKIDIVKPGDNMRSGRMPMEIDVYLPIYTILQFFFYMGLLKVSAFFCTVMKNINLAEGFLS